MSGRDLDLIGDFVADADYMDLPNKINLIFFQKFRFILLGVQHLKNMNLNFHRFGNLRKNA